SLADAMVLSILSQHGRRQTHQTMTRLKKAMGGDLAVMTLPVPLNSRCNSAVKTNHSSHAEACELARLSIAVWLVDRTKFESFHDYVFTQRPRYQMALQHARGQVDAAALDKQLAGTLPGEYINRHVSLYKRAGEGTLPKMLFPGTVVAGAVQSDQSLGDMVRRYAK
ncbi:MAG: hypothetical protein AAFN70_14315, partial [Planctomycetota bacterium]